MMLKLIETDSGNCRVYYKSGKSLYCFQDDGSWGKHEWKFYVCSRDGEPSHEVKPPSFQIDGLPDDDSSTTRQFCEWFSAAHEWQVWK